MDYNIVRSKRKSIAIEIDKDAQVTIRAPYRMPNYAIKVFVKEKQEWIDKHIQKTRERISKKKAVEPLTKEMIDELYDIARDEIPRRVSYYATVMGVDYGRITIRCQKTRWGSCSSKGNLNFNCLLMLVTSDVRDYVIVHELAHRRHMNHSIEFWKEVELLVPDYKDKRKWLAEHGEELMYRVSKCI